MRIYVDMDDVLCDTAGAYLRLLRQEYDKDIAFDEIFSFNLQESFDLAEEEMAVLFRRAHEPDFILEMEPIHHMKHVMDTLNVKGDTIAIVTGRHTSAYEASQQWFIKWSIPYHSFTMVDKYGWPDTDRDRAISLDDLSSFDYDIGIEDSPKMAEFLSGGLNIPVLLFDRPWNKSYPANSLCTRCDSWEEVAAAIEIRRCDII